MSDPMVRCSGLELTDDSGAVRARLSMSGTDPTYEMLNSDGVVLVRISAGSEGGTVCINDPSGKPRLEATVDGDDPCFRLLDDRGVRRLSAVIGNDGAYLALRSSTGSPALIATGFESRPTIALFNEDGKAPVIELGCMPEPALILRDNDSVNRLIASLEPAGDCGVRVFDRQSIPRATLGTEADESAALRVMDSVGTTRGYLGTEAHGTCRLSLVETEGSVRFETMVNNDGLPQSSMYGRDGLPRIGVRVLPDGTPRSTFFDNLGKPRLVSEVAHSGESLIAFLDERGVKRVQVQQVGPSGDGLYLGTDDDVIRGSFSIVEKQIVLSLRDSDGLMRSGMKVDNLGVPVAVLRDSYGKDRIVLQIPEESASEVDVEPEPVPKICILSGDGKSEIVRFLVDGDQQAMLFVNDYRGRQCFVLDAGMGSPTMSFNSTSGDGYIYLHVAGNEAKVEVSEHTIYQGS